MLASIAAFLVPARVLGDEVAQIARFASEVVPDWIVVSSALAIPPVVVGLLLRPYRNFFETELPPDWPTRI